VAVLAVSNYIRNQKNRIISWPTDGLDRLIAEQFFGQVYLESGEGSKSQQVRLMDYAARIACLFL
jgi:hypothetical protein